MNLLSKLDLAYNNEPEIMTLAGKLEILFYEYGEGDMHIENAITYFQKGVYILANRYGYLNLAYSFTCRANSSLCDTDADRIADLIYAGRCRKKVLELCERDWVNVKSD